MYRQDLEAYVSLEEARLRCERLDGQAGDSGERGMLRAVHRELGLAGFFASERTATPQRLLASELQGNPRQTRVYTSSKPIGRQSRLQPGRSPSST